MKTSSHRFIFISLLILASFCSYAYLNMVSIEDVATTHPTHEPLMLTEEAENENQEIYLPDVEIIKKAVETGKKILSIATGLTQ